MKQGFPVASIFTDHMVLQRQMEIRVWGTADDEVPASLGFAASSSPPPPGKSGGE
jgi:hypothetical protein